MKKEHQCRKLKLNTDRAMGYLASNHPRTYLGISDLAGVVEGRNTLVSQIADVNEASQNVINRGISYTIFSIAMGVVVAKAKRTWNGLRS